MRNVELLKFYKSIIRVESELREGRDYCICIALLKTALYTRYSVLSILYIPTDFESFSHGGRILLVL